MLELNTNDFYETIKSKDKVLVDFWATWCEPCKAMLPILTDINENIVEVCKIDVDKNVGLAQDLQIKSMPTVILFEDGSEVKRVIGAKPKNELLEELGINDRLIGNEAPHDGQ